MISGAQGLVAKLRLEGAHPRPVGGPLDEVALYGIGEVVDHLAEHVLGLHETDDAGLLHRPEVLPATAQGVLVLGEELVEALEEPGVVTVAVVNAGM